MHYSNNAGSVRIDFFKASGEWYETLAIDMGEYYEAPASPKEAVIAALDNDETTKKWWRNRIDDGMIIVCLEPYHHNSYPICIKRVKE